ncbi:MAG: hypothetical protein WCO66_05275, partial [Candidatus Absconditabacteria bacterium]
NPFAASTETVETPVQEIQSFEDLNLPQEEPVVETAPVVEEVLQEEISISPFEQEQAPVVEETPVAELPIEETLPEEIAVVEETIPETPVVEETPVVAETAPVVEVSDIRAKYNELANNITVLNTGSEEAITIVGSNTDTTHVEYRFTKEDDILEVTRIELAKDTDESTENIIAFVADGDEGQIQVFLDDTLLFEEQELVEDAKKKMQVMEKFNKFIFLTAEKLKDVEKARKAQEAELQEKRRLQDIFRNF